jgi:uncharacterized protein (DUF983 family)
LTASPKVNPFVAGLAGRCPACGEGKLFDGFTKVADRCEICSADLTSYGATEGPAVFIILIVGTLMGFGALITEVAVAPPVWVHLIIWLPLTCILCGLLMRPLKGVMVASQYRNKAAEAGRHDL